MLRTCALTVATLWLAGCDAEIADADSGEYVHRVVAAPLVASAGYDIERRFAGIVSPRQSSSLGFELAGQLASLSVDEGDLVRKGDALATLDTRLLEDERQRLEAQREDAASRLALAKRNLERARALRPDGFTTERDIDQLETEVSTLSAQIDQIKAARQSNSTRLEKSRLVAPFDATISRRHKDEGAVVATGEPVFTLLESQGLEVRVGVPVRMLAQLETGAAVTIEIHGVPAPGYILALGNDVTRATLTVPVRVALPDTVRAVAGDQASILLVETETQPGFWLPATAITDGLRGLWNVYALVPAEEPDRFLVEARDVRVNHANAEQVYVSGAVTEDELVMTGGLHRVVPGQVVRLAIEEAVAQQ